MRKEYELTEEQLTTLLEACRAVPAIMLQCGAPASPQENANVAWRRLGKELGFEPMTVKPVAGRGDRFFTAEWERTKNDPGYRKARPTPLAQALTDWRLAEGLRQADVADALEIARTTWANYELGNFVPRRIVLLALVARWGTAEAFLRGATTTADGEG